MQIELCTLNSCTCKYEQKKYWAETIHSCIWCHHLPFRTDPMRLNEKISRLHFVVLVFQRIQLQCTWADLSCFTTSSGRTTSLRLCLCILEPRSNGLRINKLDHRLYFVSVATLVLDDVWCTLYCTDSYHVTTGCLSHGWP